jgi:hypothetical protein
MNSEQIKTFLLFPVKDAYARQQFLIACLVMLVGMVVPIIPLFFLIGYGARIARQIVLEHKEPTMSEWDNWDEFFRDGARLYGIRILIALPVLLLIIIAIILFIVSSIGLAGADQNHATNNVPPWAFASFIVAMAILMLAILLALPLGILAVVAETHVAVKGSFSAGLRFKEWWPILRKGLSQFLIAYLIIFVMSFLLSFVIQIAVLTIILVCIVPFVIFPYAAYLSLVLQALFAKAYESGMSTPQTAS